MKDRAAEYKRRLQNAFGRLTITLKSPSIRFYANEAEGNMENQLPDHSAGAGSAYRAYLIGASGRIASVIDVLAQNDDEAIRQAEAIDHSGAVELWDRGRVIFRHAKADHALHARS